MNNTEQFAKVKKNFDRYIYARSKAGPFQGTVTPKQVTNMILRTQKEISILEQNRVHFKTMSMRIRPTVNGVVPRQIQTNMKVAISMLDQYINDYKRINSAWKKHNNKGQNALPLFPFTGVEKNSDIHFTAIRFASRLNEYMQHIVTQYHQVARVKKTIFRKNVRVENLEKELNDLQKRHEYQSNKMKRTNKEMEDIQRHLIEQRNKNKKKANETKEQIYILQETVQRLSQYLLNAKYSFQTLQKEANKKESVIEAQRKVINNLQRELTLYTNTSQVKRESKKRKLLTQRSALRKKRKT